MFVDDEMSGYVSRQTFQMFQNKTAHHFKAFFSVKRAPIIIDQLYSAGGWLLKIFADERPEIVFFAFFSEISKDDNSSN